MSTQTSELTDAQKIGTLAGAILFIIQGCRNKQIKSKPIVDTSDPEAQEMPMISLEEHMWKALNKCGIRESKPNHVEVP